VTTALTLLGYAVIAGVFGGRVLGHRLWVERAPRLGIVVWQALSASILLAVVFAGLIVVLPTVDLTEDLAALLEACVMALRAQYATPGGALTATLGAALAVLVIGRALCVLVAELVRARRGRRRQLEMLALIGRRHARLGAVIVDHPLAAAYCLPGRGRQVVLTTGALERLDEAQLDAVLAHELAHLRGRHHLVLAAAAALARAFPFVPAFRTGCEEVARLIEMLADDAATRRCDRMTVAAALVALAEGAAPAASLAAGGPAALSRVDRLVGPARPLGALRTVVGAAVAGILLVAPLAVAVAPAAAATHADFCPIDWPIAG
jgi:Zn-dependent protease with chaperone function